VQSEDVRLTPFDYRLSCGQIRGLRRHGDGLPVLALHGWLDNAASFVPLAGELADVDLLIPDLPGHGHSDWLPAAADYSMTAAVVHVLELADHLGWSRFVLLGHSMGAGIASLVAAAAPERVQALVVIEALGSLGESADNTATRLRQSVHAARSVDERPLRLFADLDAPVRARMIANQLDASSARLLVERGVQQVAEGWQWRSDRRLTLPSAVRLTEPQIEDLLAAIQCPTQVIYATPAQNYFPEPLRSQRVALLAQGRLATLPGVHHLHMQQPQAVAAIVREFLATL
jgi:pimeloyl-ACP methyl ester carboxylesterase